MRINARLDEELAAKLRYLMANTHSNVSEAVKTAIEHYYNYYEQQEASNAAEILESCGFIGCSEGEANLSTDYKSKLDSWGEKHDHH